MDQASLFYRLSHDLDAPLRHIESFSELLSGSAIDKLNRDEIQYLEFILGASGKARAMLSTLLQLHKIETDPHPKEKVDFKSLLDEELGKLGAIIESNQVKTEIVGDGLLTVCKDDLHEIVRQLLKNSISFKNLETPLTISVRLVTSQNDSLLTIADNGIGIESTLHEKAFDLFKTLHTEEFKPGIGGGLAICKALMEKNNGTIDIIPKGVDGGPGTTLELCFR